MRALLAYLLLHANEPVSSDRLIDQVWGPDPPRTAAASLQNYVSRLRKAIGAELLQSQPPGYLLRVDPEHFDLARFERLTTEAQGREPQERAEKLRAALAEWRGPALEDLAYEPFARDEIERLEEARLRALEGRLDADLTLGRAAEVAGELEELVEAHPLRERPRAQLMLALYRLGRQADALAAYREARRVLLDELGLEPSEDLRSLQQAILRQDPSLQVEGASEPTRPPDRRTVTVLFCDLVDSTGLAAELDPEVYRTVMSQYFEAVQGPIAGHGGTLEKFIGDAVMAVFGVPQLHEDDALRAVRAAAEVQAALRGLDVAARIGVSTGEVHVLSERGADLHVSGAAASIASQLEGHAPPGGILLADETYRLVRDAVRAERVDAGWRLDDVLADAPGYARRLDAPLVGRQAELARVRDAYTNAVNDKHCRAVTIVGEAGIGKTRLARELVGALRAEALVLVGRCVSYGDGATYLPIAELIRAATGDPSLEAIQALLEGEEDGDAVAQYVAELAGVAESPAAPGETFWAVRRLLEALARKSPVLVVLDDIHWAEPTLLDLVEYLGEWAEGPILLLCLARPDLLEQRPGWGGPTSTGFLVELDPLPELMLGTLIEQLAGEPVDELQQRITELSGGNPLFAEQLLALSREAPELGLETPPATVEALLASRLDRLDSRELALLRQAAVVGRRFTRTELDDLLPGDGADRRLASLSERGLIHLVADVFRFHHALLRDVAYRGIPKADRAEFHERAGKGIDRRDGPDEIVGYHYEQAYRYLTELRKIDAHASGLAAAAAECLGRAGIRAWKRADAPAAEHLLSRAFHLVPDSELACELGVVHRVRGDLTAAETVLAQAAQADEERVRLRAQIELTLIRTYLDPDRAGELLDLASASIPVLEAAHDERALSRAWLCVGQVKGGFHCDFGAWEDATSRAADYYRRAGWSPSTSLGDHALALFFGPREVTSAIARCEALLVEHEGDRASEANLLLWLGGLKAMHGDFTEARDLVQRAGERYRELGLGVDDYLRAAAAVEMLAGAPQRAEEILRQAAKALQDGDQTAILATRAGELADALYAQGRYEEASRWTRIASESAGVDDIDAALSWRPTEAKLLAQQERFDEAESFARETVELAGRTDAIGRQGDALQALAEVLLGSGKTNEARDALRTALERYETKGNVVAAERVRALLGVETE